MKKQWYALSVYPGESEEDVRRDIPRTARRVGVGHRVGRVIIARHQEPRTVAGRTVMHRVKSYPGYLILSLAFNDDVLGVIQSVRGVEGLLPLRVEGRVWKPTALDSKEEVELLLREQAAKKPKPNPYAEAQRMYNPKPEKPTLTPERRFLIGQQVGIKAGTFAGFFGTVRGIKDYPAVTVEVQFMGRVTVADVDEQALTKV